MFPTSHLSFIVHFPSTVISFLPPTGLSSSPEVVSNKTARADVDITDINIDLRLALTDLSERYIGISDIYGDLGISEYTYISHINVADVALYIELTLELVELHVADVGIDIELAEALRQQYLHVRLDLNRLCI